MIIADTGFWLALANVRDRHHERAHRHQTLAARVSGLVEGTPLDVR